VVSLVSFTRTQVLKRSVQVARVLGAHGFGLVASLMAPKGHWLLPRPKEGRGERLRDAMEELGPAFIKLGQMLSTRADLLPPDIVMALERLQDQVKPIPYAQIAAVIEAELGQPPEIIFQQISTEAIATASIGQVHEVLLQDGRPAVIKVQRPGVVEQIEIDLHVLERLANLVASRTQFGATYDLPGVVREFGAMLRGELDYRLEAQNAERFRTNFAGDPQVRFPEVYHDYSTARVLTLEQIHGLRVTDLVGLKNAQINPSDVAQRLAGAIFQMVLRDGFVHADPHPGNLFVLPDGVVGFVDCGMVGELTPAMRNNVVDYVLGVVSGDSDQVVQAIIQMGVVQQRYNSVHLRQAVERLQQKYGNIPLKQVKFGPALQETLALARSFSIRFPSAYTTLLKAMTTLEAVARQVDPEATLIGLAAPFTRKVLQERLKAESVITKAGRELASLGRHALRLPRQASRVLALMEEGELRIVLEHRGLAASSRRLTAASNRLTIAILLASLIVGTALVSSGGPGDTFLQRYPIADVGFVLIGAVGLWLVISILGSHQR
jgi:ubiquinone biosynthesis protein